MPAINPTDLPVPQLDFVFQIKVYFEERHWFDGPNGRRSYVPVVRGTVEGPRLNGKVVPRSGADFALSGALNAHYMLEADDGTLIYLNNRGYLFRTDGSKDFASKAPPGVEYYFRLVPVFDTKIGPHDWLTRTVIIGIGERFAEPDHTRFTYYALK
ncbi:MAG TPA: DUF3237 domain-containing protein [Xanthobacteraceae bacterium]